ncbi:MAG: hypothetical protein ACJ751_11395, partial [Niastella sp.]|uniref:hypothetical protein n=1 Tax=Niastella sp. TaxID=1869183 RepID=UPI00389B2971
HAIKRFEEVETILQPVLTKLKIGQGDFEQNVYGVDFKGTIRKAVPIQGLAGVDASFIENMTYIDTENEAQILPVLTELKKATLVLENEFINKYQTLQQVYDAVQEMTPKERGEFISMPGPIRNLVIEALCNPSADLDTKFERTIADSKDAEKRHPDVFKNYDKAASELQKYFKSRKA